MNASPQRSESDSTLPATLTMPPAAGWQQKTYWLFLNRLTLPLLGLSLVFAGVGAMAFLIMANPQHANTFYPLLGALLLAGLALVWLIIARVRRDLVEPLSHLRNWSLRMRGGNLSARIPVPGGGEFRELAQDINRLSDELKSLTMEMDSHVRAQTVRLARKTQSLDILYDVASSLSQPGDLDKLLESFLDTFIELVDARAATVRLLTGDGQTRLVASRGLSAEVVEKDRTMDTSLCQCGWAAKEGGIRIQHGTQPCARLLGMPMLKRDCQEFVVVPVTYQDRILGVYNLFLDRPMSALGEDIQDLLNSVGKHLGLALEKSRLDNHARQIAIMEERNIIGNELHDSLAQGLVSMRLQVKMLGESLHKKDLRASQSEVRHLRSAIDEAHDSLRELLANYRLKIDERGLVPAVAGMVERFSQETGINVYFHNECRRLSLTPLQESQIFHIVKEALSNIRKHSHACNARILLNNDSHGGYTLLIEDDGEGIAPVSESRPGEHIGLSVMRERAERLPGELTIESEPGEGTRIVLSFPVVPAKTTAAK
ncbi:histidine kinase [Sulfuricaulis limicola]|uniref:Sensor protein n=1 Tax=Sulfuricaulis limicola TaxID=1620215 RepID=A0A1B4XFK0_9GAMM|nr:ATP-binding protein [Sulfuricaulis limicola]BAV33572.1 histidine kinase [Sulfuricaulis limicola]